MNRIRETSQVRERALRVLQVVACACMVPLFLADMVNAKDLGVSLGEAEYLDSCAICHGPLGKGDGPLALYLKNSVPDLTGLTKANGGVFPVSKTYAIIDGTKVSGEHGTRNMPAWGRKYSLQAEGDLRRYSLGYEDRRQTYVRARILALIDYLASIQE